MTVLPTETGLSVLMRDGSQAEHTAAEGSTFMSELLAGRVDEAGYAHFLGLLRRVYEALEAVGAELADDPDRRRPSSIRPSSGSPRSTPTSTTGPARRRRTARATDAYVARIRASAVVGRRCSSRTTTRATSATCRAARRSAASSRASSTSPTAPASRSTRSTHVPKPKLYKDAYRARLDALPLDDAERERVLDEVKDGLRVSTAASSPR